MNKLAAGIKSIISSPRYQRLLWQELNKKFGGGDKSVFVMTTGQTLLHSDYDTSNPAAGFNTFELVDKPLLCSINYSPAESRISVKWEQLLNEGKGPNAGPQQQAAFEKAKQFLYDKYDTEYSDSYKKYLELKKACRQKEVQMEKELQEKYNDDWKVHFEKEFYACDEYMDYDSEHRRVDPHLKAIEQWKEGPLAGILKPVRQAFNDHLQTVTLPGGNEVKYCDVSMIPPNWYQWFDQSYSDDDDSQWDVISVDGNQDNDDKLHSVYKALGGPDDGTDTHSKSDLQVQLSLKVCAVEIKRPWLDAHLTTALGNGNFKVPGDKAGSWSSGELSNENKGSFSLLSKQMIVGKNFRITASENCHTTNSGHDDNHESDDALDFGVGGDYTIKRKEIYVTFKGTKVMGYHCTLLQKYPEK